MMRETEKILIEGQEYILNKHTYAALSNDEKNPLYCVSVSNNSFSIDIWRGCLLDCAYCHVQGCYGDLKEKKRGGLSINYKPTRRNKSTIREIVSALIHYEGFIPNYSPVSICTSSTEPFLGDEIIQSTIDIMHEFIKQGMKNPFWIVTKVGGIDIKWKDEVVKIIEHGNKILISVCWTNNLIEIEPYHQNRFINLDWMEREGVLINWYMRPLVKEWNASLENIRLIMEQAKKAGINFVNICAGGLRWTEGIEFGLKCIHKLEMPKLVKNDNEKTLDIEIEKYIKKLGREIFPDTPIYIKSSCALSEALKLPEINLLQFSFDKHCMDCPIEQKERCDTIKKIVYSKKCILDLPVLPELSQDEVLNIIKNNDYADSNIAIKKISFLLYKHYLDEYI